MKLFAVYSHELLIGYSELETGDPPMGVVSGKFRPVADYERVQHAVVAARESSQSGLGLSVRTSVDVAIQAAGGVHILDCSDELVPEEIEITVLCLDSVLYEELFPHHLAAYDARF